MPLPPANALEMPTDWVICQIGAREHYAVARGFAEAGNLHCLITDAWVPPGHWTERISQSLRERYHPALSEAQVRSWTASLIRFELSARMRKVTGWPLIISRNAWFQQRAVQALAALAKAGLGSGDSRPAVFAYSYAALEPFRYARQRGWKTILGQIDPAIVEERIVADVCKRSPQLAANWQPAPASYWQAWHDECGLANQIVVNSQWSKEALIQAGVEAFKIHIIPLAYEPHPEADACVRTYPQRFSPTRPLRVLFLGQLTPRKGMDAILTALSRLLDEPIEWWFVGPLSTSIPADLKRHPKTKWFGHVPRSHAARFYRDADVFLFPTHSDGFGLTQLEAASWHLPMIASRFCGAVVEHDRSGIVLPEVTPQAIAEALLRCVENPQLLAALASAAIPWSEFSVGMIAEHFENLAIEPPLPQSTPA